jgi:pimeloyl-ACP methyl ester carboxylesterase
MIRDVPVAHLGDIDIHYESLGEGAPLLLIMGLGMQMIAWPDPLCALLVEHGFRVIRFDNRDIGMSTQLDHLGKPHMRALVARGAMNLPIRSPYTLGDMARDTVGLLDALEIEHAHVVGASMGGMIAQVMAIEHPARVRSLTSLMSHPGDLRSKLARPAALRALLAPIPRDPDVGLTHLVGVLRVLSSPGFPFDEAAVRAMCEHARTRGFHPHGFLRQMAAVAAAPSRVAALRRLRTPTLVLHGTDDPLIPPVAARTTARVVPGARLHWIRGMGHDLPRGAWPEMAAVIAGHAQEAERRPALPVRSARLGR